MPLAHQGETREVSSFLLKLLLTSFSFFLFHKMVEAGGARFSLLTHLRLLSDLEAMWHAPLQTLLLWGFK